MTRICLWVVRLLAIVTAASSSSANTPAASASNCSPLPYCPTSCTRQGGIETDGLALLVAHEELVANVGKAVKIARSFPGVQTDDALDVHITFEYICCVTLEEIVGKVFPALDAVEWAPINVSYSEAICNVDGSIILAVDDASQAALSAVVSRFEAAIKATGVPVVPRATMQGFHTTIGTTNATYPMAEALAAINAAIPRGSWTTPFPLTNFAFFFPVPHEVKATLPARAQ
jgi:hypothetical protein